MTTETFPAYVDSKPSPTMTLDTVVYSQSAGVPSQHTVRDIFNATTPFGTVFVESLDDLPSPVGGIRTLATFTRYIIAGVIVDTNSWRIPNSGTVTIQGEGNINFAVYSGIGDFIISDSHADLTIQRLALIGPGGTSSTKAFNLAQSSVVSGRTRLRNCTVSGFGGGYEADSAATYFDNVEFDNMTNHITIKNGGLDASTVQTLNDPAISGAIHYTTSNNAFVPGLNTMFLNNILCLGRTGETHFKIDIMTEESNIISLNSGNIGFPGESPTNYDVTDTRSISGNISDNAGFPEIFVPSNHNLVSGDWIFIEGDNDYVGPQEVKDVISTTQFTIDTPFITATANFSRYTVGSLTNRSRVFSIRTGIRGVDATKVCSINGISNEGSTNIITTGDFKLTNGTWDGHAGGVGLGTDTRIATPDPLTNIMTRCQSADGGKTTYLGRDDQYVTVKIWGAMQDVGGADVCQMAVLINGTVIDPRSLAPRIATGEDSGYYIEFLYKAQYGDTFEHVCTNHINNTDNVINRIGTTIALEFAI